MLDDSAKKAKKGEKKSSEDYVRVKLSGDSDSKEDVKNEQNPEKDGELPDAGNEKEEYREIVRKVIPIFKKPEKKNEMRGTSLKEKQPNEPMDLRRNSPRQRNGGKKVSPRKSPTGSDKRRREHGHKRHGEE
ncbi:hypothetical protein V3C99_014530 [Haemonchus contortus]